MSEPNLRIVEFDKYCDGCQFKDCPETEDPCNECLERGWNWNTDQPHNYKEQK